MLGRVTAAAVATAFALAAGHGAARADEPDAFSIGAEPAWFFLGGVTGGGTVATGERGGFVGGELSLARIERANVAGFYADSYYDFGAGATYLTVGPEVARHLRRLTVIRPEGLTSLGIDGGLALRFDDGTDVGATGRVYVTVFGLFSIYGRYTWLDAGEDDHVVQVGVSLKFLLSRPFGPGAP